eukprot:Skav215471  [mRNA]  locus=scaffold1089:811397:812974:- [translate_table: standard]
MPMPSRAGEEKLDELEVCQPAIFVAAMCGLEWLKDQETWGAIAFRIDRPMGLVGLVMGGELLGYGIIVGAVIIVGLTHLGYAFFSGMPV